MNVRRVSATTMVTMMAVSISTVGVSGQEAAAAGSTPTTTGAMQASAPKRTPTLRVRKGASASFSTRDGQFVCSLGWGRDNGPTCWLRSSRQRLKTDNCGDGVRQRVDLVSFYQGKINATNTCGEQESGAVVSRNPWWRKNMGTYRSPMGTLAVLPYGTVLTNGISSCSASRTSVTCTHHPIRKRFVVTRTSFRWYRSH